MATTLNLRIASRLIRPVRNAMALWALAALAGAATAQTYAAGNVLNSPECIRLAGASLELPADEVIGVGRAREYCAYTIKMMAYHRIVNDHLGGPPIVVAYDPESCVGAVYDPVIQGKAYTFAPAASLGGAPAITDNQTHSTWHIATGAAVSGPLKGTVLKRLQSTIMTNARWMQLHPDSWTLKEDPTQLVHYIEHTEQARIILTGAGAADRFGGELVFGLAIGATVKAWPFTTVAQRGLIALHGAGHNLVVLYDPGGNAASAYIAEADGKSLNFKSVDQAGSRLFEDAETHSIWNIEGVAIAGKLVNTALTQLTGGRSRWYAWKALYPHCRL